MTFEQLAVTDAIVYGGNVRPAENWETYQGEPAVGLSHGLGGWFMFQRLAGYIDPVRVYAFTPITPAEAATAKPDDSQEWAEWIDAHAGGRPYVLGVWTPESGFIAARAFDRYDEETAEGIAYGLLNATEAWQSRCNGLFAGLEWVGTVNDFDS